MRSPRDQRPPEHRPGPRYRLPADPWPRQYRAMLLRQLVYLRALSRERHFGRAAAACGVSQPTLSAALKQLESEFAVPIVQRSRRFEGFTPEGTRIVAWAQRILADCEGLNQEIGELRHGLVGHLRIGAIPTALSMVPRLTTPFHGRHPNVALSVFSQTSQQIQRALDNFEIDVGVTYLDNEPLAHVRTLPFYRERYILVTPKDGAAGRRRTIPWAEAAKLPLCLLTPDMQNRRILNGIFLRVAAQPHSVIETNSVATLWAHLRQGRWSSVMPQTFLALFGAFEGLRAIPLVQPEASHIIGLTMADREPLLPVTRAMLDAARTVARRLDRQLAVT
jgi:DNA-binding transcriptional LysR family regulator